MARTPSLVVGVFVALLLCGASAHADLAASTPGQFEEVPPGLTSLELVFTMEVELRFSAFDVLRVDLPDDMLPANLDAPTPAEERALATWANSQLREVGSDELLALTVEPAAGSAAAITLTFAEPLTAASYALAYEALAVDGHTTAGYLFFFVRE